MTKAENARRKALLGKYLDKLGGRNKDAKSVARALIKQGITMATPCSSGKCPIALGVLDFARRQGWTDVRRVSVGGSDIALRFKGHNGAIDIGDEAEGFAERPWLDEFVGEFDSHTRPPTHDHSDSTLVPVSCVLGGRA